MKTKIQRILSGLTIMLFTTSAFAVPVVLTIEFDNFPNETAFGMWDAGSAPSGAAYAADPGLALDGIAYDVGASSPIGFGDGFVLPGDFSGEPANVPFTFVWDLGVADYSFIILDSFGDGICCGFGAGSYSLAVNGHEVGAGGEFAEFEVTQFMVDNPVPEPGTLSLIALGLLGLALGQRRRKTKV